MIKNIFALVLTLFFSGCAISPGMTMFDEPSEQQDTYKTDSGVMIVPITTDLIYRQASQKKRETSPASEKLRKQEQQNYHYIVGPRDILNITVWDHPELTIPAGEFRSAEAAGHLVAEDGTIFYPYAGLVKVAGKTVREIRDILTKRISRAIARPQLDVRVAAFRSQKAFVVGEVVTPGQQPISDVPLTIVEAVNRAGGVTRDADMVNVTLSRKGKVIDIDLLAMYEQGDVLQNFILDDGDILHVPDRSGQKIFVMGEVARPASILMNKGRMTLSEAISEAGGVDRFTSNPSRIYVIRGKQASTEIFHLNSKSPEALILGDQFALMPRDVVYVDAAGVTRWNRVIEQLVPTSTLLRNISNIKSEQFDE
ncbi:MAG: polysaccharide export protein [Gammaproteobacteria bacterium]|nr:polysaccharide export protein [Gammaproteobacteria bacterium]